MATITVGQSHPRVDKLKSARSAELGRLYYVDADKVQRPRYSPEIHAQNIAEIDKRFNAELSALQDEAERAAAAAETVLARSSNPYKWLTSDETARAAVLASFIREDLAAMDAAAVLNTVQSAAGSGDKVMQWLIARYAPMRWRELDATIETSPGMTKKAQYEPALKSLRDGLMPTAERAERDLARSQHADAKRLYDSAEWAKPATRQNFATTMHVQEQYLP